MMVYYVVGNADKWVSPDVFVTHGIHKMPERETYKLWVEGKGPMRWIQVPLPKARRAWTSAGSSPFTATCSRWAGNISCSIPGKRRWLEFHFAATGWSDGQYELIPKSGDRLVSEVLGLHLEAVGQPVALRPPSAVRTCRRPKKLAKSWNANRLPARLPRPKPSVRLPLASLPSRRCIGFGAV